jgi:hypothetical protein
MKIFMTVLMMMLMTSVFAGECKVGDTCTQADCKAASADYALSPDGKCLSTKESLTDCTANDNNSRAAKDDGSTKQTTGSDAVIKK